MTQYCADILMIKSNQARTEGNLRLTGKSTVWGGGVEWVSGLVGGLAPTIAYLPMARAISCFTGHMTLNQMISLGCLGLHVVCETVFLFTCFSWCISICVLSKHNNALQTMHLITFSILNMDMNRIHRSFCSLLIKSDSLESGSILEHNVWSPILGREEHRSISTTNRGNLPAMNKMKHVLGELMNIPMAGNYNLRWTSDDCFICKDKCTLWQPPLKASKSFN